MDKWLTELKIALILPSLPIVDEVSIPADQQLVRLLGARAEIHVYTLFHPPGRRSFRSGNVSVHPSGGGRYRKLFARVLNDIRIEHRRSAFDVIHANRLYPGGLLAIVAGRWLGVPSVASVGGVELIHFADIGYGGSQTRLARVLNGYVLDNADLVTVPSRYILRQAKTVRPTCRYELAPLPVAMRIDDIDCGPAANVIDPGRPRIFSAASLYPLKDQETLIRAFSIVHSEIPGAVLTIVGGDPFGYQQLLECIVAELELGDAVVFAGQISHDEIGEYYQDADLFLYASRHESQGLVILEAALHGLPIVSTAVGIAPELAPDAAVAVAVRDPIALGTATLKILNDPERSRKLGQNAARYVQEMFDDGRIVERFIEIYRLASR